MSVTLLEVMAAAHARRAPLVSELAGYLVLGAADQTAGAPRYIRALDLTLAEDGGVRVVGNGEACGSDAAEEALRDLLGQLLRVASSVTPALFRSTQRSSGGGIEVLIRELETALIPVNRSAARRALSRLHRETMRALASGRVDVATFGDPEALAPPRRAPAPPVAPPPVSNEWSEPVAAPPPPATAPDEWSEPVAAPPRANEWSEPVAAPPPPELTPSVWSVPIEVLEESPDLCTLPLATVASPREEETAPEPAVARARASDRPPQPEVVLELSPPAPVPAVEQPPTTLPAALPASRNSTPVLGTLCDEPGPVDDVDADTTDRAPPAFDDEPTHALELRVAPAQEAASAAQAAGPQPLIELEDEDIEWIELDPSDDAPPARAAEPFDVAPSADPPGVAASWRPSVVVASGAKTANTRPGPPTGEPEPTPPSGVESVEESPIRFGSRRSDISQLLASFAVAETCTDRELRGDLKRMAGLDPTPPPPQGGSQADETEAGDDEVVCEAR